MSSVTSASRRSKKEVVDQVDESDGAVSDSDAASSGTPSDNEDDASDSDSLDSVSPRKRRRTSPAAVEVAEPRIITSAFNVPSRIKRNPPATTTVKPAQTLNLELGLESRVTAPLDATTTFDSLGLRPWLVQSLANMAIKRPTAIQRESIPALLKGRDCIGGSRTGSGKTVAFSVPILQKWAENPSAIFAVILTPTR